MHSQSDEPGSNFQIDAIIDFPQAGIQGNCLIRHIRKDIYKICEHPLFAEGQVLYGDCARMLKVDEQNYQFQEVVSKSNLIFVQHIINDAIFSDIAGTLDKVMRSDGYWQTDFGGILSLYFAEELFDPRMDLEAVFDNHQKS